jgi:hypothetical protein
MLPIAFFNPSIAFVAFSSSSLHAKSYNPLSSDCCVIKSVLLYFFFHLDLFVQFFHASQVGLDTASSRSTNALLISRRVSLDRRFRKFASHTRIKFYNSSLLLRNISVIIYKSGSDTISGKARQLEPAQVPKPT